jgi:hypothetical protein
MMLSSAVGGSTPLHAVQQELPVIEKQIKKERRRIQALFGNLRVRYVQEGD